MSVRRKFYKGLIFCGLLTNVVIVYFLARHRFLYDAQVMEIDRCVYPNLKPYDKEVLDYLPPSMDHALCPKVGPDMFASDLSTIYQIPHDFVNYTKLKCSYRVAEDWLKFTKPTAIHNASLALVKCTYLNKIIYKDYVTLAPKFQTLKKKTYNVLVVLLRDVNRLSFQRGMSDTQRVLKRLHFLDMQRPNVITLDGIGNVAALMKGCDDFRCNGTYVWERFKRRGFRIAYAEDGLKKVLNTDSMGFDYDLSLGRKLQEYYGSKWNDNLHPFCLRNRMTHSVLLNFGRQLLNRSRKSEQSFFIWLTLNAAKSSEKRVWQLDEDFAAFFSYLSRAAFLNETFVFFVSDQGDSLTTLHTIQRGFVESLTPFMYISVPSWFKASAAYNSLKRNRDAAVTAFEVHHGLKKLADPKYSKSGLFSVSIRRDVNPQIPAEYRTCFWREVNVNATDVLRAAEFSIDYVNYKIKNSNCASIRLSKIVSSRFTNDGFIYSIRFSVQPQGIYESVVYKLERRLVIKSVFRLGAYDDACVHGNALKSICVCAKGEVYATAA